MKSFLSIVRSVFGQLSFFKQIILLEAVRWIRSLSGIFPRSSGQCSGISAPNGFISGREIPDIQQWKYEFFSPLSLEKNIKQANLLQALCEVISMDSQGALSNKACTTVNRRPPRINKHFIIWVFGMEKNSFGIFIKSLRRVRLQQGGSIIFRIVLKIFREG